METFSIIHLPDTQHYSRAYPEIFNAQTQWIKDHVATNNVKLITHTGDVIDDSSSLVQWGRARTAMNILGVSTPLSVIAGNHDQYGSGKDRFREYFPSSKYSGQSWFVGVSLDGLSMAQEFTAGGYSFLHIGIKFQPSTNYSDPTSTISWAKGVIEAHPNHLVIISTHSFLHYGHSSSGYPDGDRTDYVASPDYLGGNGKGIWEQLCVPYPKVILVICGHNHGTYYRRDESSTGYNVDQILADYQGDTNGGNGYLRVIQVTVGDDATLNVSTYSPYLFAEKTTTGNTFTTTARGIIGTLPDPSNTASEVWTLEYLNTEKSLEDWGFSGMSKTQVSQGVDTVTWREVATDATVTAQIPYDGRVIIRRKRKWHSTARRYLGGSQWFVGTVTNTPRNLSSSDQSYSYKAEGPWRNLSKRVFQQSWKYDDGTGAKVTKTTTKLFLGQKAELDEDGNIQRQDISEQIREILTWAQVNGTQFAIGTTGPEVDTPIDEVNVMTCSECISRMLRWAPDAVTWFDYSTAIPTFNVTSHGDLQAISLPFGSRPLSSFTIDRRDDLKVSCVVLKFDRTSTVNGVEVPEQYIQKYPLTASEYQEGAFISQIDLKGWQANFVTASIACQTLPGPTATEPVWKAWFAQHIQWLNNTSMVSAVTLDLSTLARTLNPSLYTQELLQGQVCSWMSYNGTAAIAGKDKISVEAVILTMEPVTGIISEHRETISVAFTATNIPSGVYNTVESLEDGDAIPEGLAQAMYESMSRDQYSGSVTLTEQEVNDYIVSEGITDRSGIGLAVNITGGASEWATMRAQVQQCVEDVDSGTTTLTFGPLPQHSIQDLIELLQVTRKRMIYTNPAMRGSGSMSAGSSIQLGKDNANENGTNGALAYAKLACAKQVEGVNISAYFDVTTGIPIMKITWGLGEIKAWLAKSGSTISGKLLIKGTDAQIEINTDDCNGKNIKFQEVYVCDPVTGEDKQMMVLGSSDY